MEDYEKSVLYSDFGLSLDNQLIDFNVLDSSVVAPFERFNPEVIFHIRSGAPSVLFPSRARIDTFLYQSYANDDLRRSLFFSANDDGTHSFQGDYDGEGDRGDRKSTRLNSSH